MAPYRSISTVAASAIVAMTFVSGIPAAAYADDVGSLTDGFIVIDCKTNSGMFEVENISVGTAAAALQGAVTAGELSFGKGQDCAQFLEDAFHDGFAVDKSSGTGDKISYTMTISGVVVTP